MSVTKIKAKTEVTQYEEQELSMSAIEVLPDMLQTRASLDKGWSLQYSRGYTKGDPIPPVLVFRLPPEESHPAGRLILVDGFHRHDARDQLGLRTIRAQVRDGTMQEALLAAIEANTAAYHRGRPFGESDRRRCVELMIRNGAGRVGEGTWDWSDTEIDRRISYSSSLVRKVRLSLRDSEGIPLPERVWRFKSGQKTDVSFPYLIREFNEPRIYGNQADGYCCRLGGKMHYLAADLETARARLAAMGSVRRESMANLESNADLLGWLNSKGINAVGISRQDSQMGGLLIGDCALIAMPRTDYDSVLRAIGLIVLVRFKAPQSTRGIVVCDRGKMMGVIGSAVKAAGFIPPPSGPVEFLEPPEVLAEFAPAPES